MYEYTHGGRAAFENEELLDLSANINPLGFPSSARAAIENEIKNCNRYPDTFVTRLRDKIAEFEGVGANQVFCGNGASDIIFRIPIALRSKKALLTAPSFSDYERALKSYGAEVIYHYLREENGFAMDATILESIKKQSVDLVFICNPNNPTGVVTDSNLIREILTICKKKNIFVVVDECFLDFVSESEKYSAKTFLPDCKNLIILKAFTKMFALPAIRLGYALCSNKEMINKLYFHGQDWAVSNLAEAAGIAALENANDYIKETVYSINAERTYLVYELKKLGYKVFESQANFVFFKNKSDLDLQKELDKKGIRIRDCNNYEGLCEGFYRVAVSNIENNQKFILRIKELEDLHG